MRIREEVTRMWGELTVNDWKAMKNEESGENTRRSYKNWGEVTRKLCESYEKWPESNEKVTKNWWDCDKKWPDDDGKIFHNVMRKQ